MDLTISAERVPQRPTLQFILQHPAHFIAFGFGTGLIRPAPGTFGTLVAFPLYWLAHAFVADEFFLILLALLFVFGMWVCNRTGRNLGVPDHGGIVFDEIVAFMLVLFMIPNDIPNQILGFLLFRLFDVWKPLPIRYYDRTLKGGFGVMLDDLLAAFYTLIVFAFWKLVMEA
jgi:phosphatidylglycerophosphatase A